MRPRLLTSSALVLLLAACGGGGGGGGSPPPAPSISYAADPALYRVGVTVAGNTVTAVGGSATAFSVAPPLPSGLTLDPSTGTIAGAPLSTATTADYVVSATVGTTPVQTTLTVQVTPALPAGVLALEPGFEVEAWKTGLANPVRMAFAPDGRLFFNELATGNVRVVAADGTLVATPVANVPVLVGSHYGLLGLALAPDFATSHALYVYASVAAGSGHPDRNQVLRLVLTGDVATSTTVVVDDLPVATLDNGGDLQFGPDGNLYVSVGDVNDATLAQTAGSLAGRILRYTPAGGIPADNPSAASPEWCRGLRNTFGTTFHPTTGGYFGADNGPNANDELNFLQKGKDYGWPSAVSGGGAGLRLAGWVDVIAPTSLHFYAGNGFGAAYAGSLFLGGYVNDEVRRLEMSGVAFTDLDRETVFAKWTSSGGLNKPLDVDQGPDGALYVATFDAIWRIRRSP